MTRPHPAPHHHPGATLPTDPQIKAATPAWVLFVSAALGWTGAAAGAMLFVLAGALISAQYGSASAEAAGTAAAMAEWAAGRSAESGVDSAVPSSSWWLSSILCATVAAAAAGASAWFSQWAASDTERRLRHEITSAIFRAGAVRASAQAGRLLSVSSAAVEKAAQYRAAFLGPITAALTTPLLVLAIMAVFVDRVIAGVLTLLILLVPVMIGGFRRLVRPVGGRYRRSQARLTAAFLDALQALGTLVHAGAAHRQAEKLARAGESHRRSLMRMLAANQLLILVVDAAFSLTVVVAAAVLAAMRVTSGSMEPGQAAAVILMTTLVIGPVDVVGQFFYIGIAGRASESQISTVLAGGRGTGRSPSAGRSQPLDTEHARSAEAGSPAAQTHHSTQASQEAQTHRAPSPSPALLLESVTAGWPGGPNILADFSLSVQPGEHVVLVGASGTGKSTTAALLQGHLLPTEGRVEVDGTAWGAGASAEQLARARAHMAVVEQRVFLFMGSIRDNLLLSAADTGSAPPTDTDLWTALDRAGLRADVESMPLGLDTQVGEQGTLLSGGQAQRVGVARAWLSQAPILLLDEPTSQVDLAAEAALIDALGTLARDRTVLMISHRPGALLGADRVVHMDGSLG